MGAVGEVFADERAWRDVGVGADAAALEHERAEADAGGAADVDGAAEVRAGLEVHAVFEHAVVVDAGRRVDDDRLAEAHLGPDDGKRLTFSPLAGGRVRQLAETTSDGGKSWVVQYDLTYSRRKESGDDARA